MKTFELLIFHGGAFTVKCPDCGNVFDENDTPDAVASCPRCLAMGQIGDSTAPAELNAPLGRQGRGRPIKWNVATFGLLATSFALSLASLVGICSDACTEAHSYRFFGTDFGWLGISVFASLGTLYFFRSKGIARSLYSIILTMSSGAEAWFLFVQKAVAGWCPLCVSIAVCVFLLSSLALAEKIKNREGRVRIVTLFKKSTFAASAFVIGLAIALFGVAKPDAEATQTMKASQNMNFWLGKADSQAEVYIVTDWFCPGCRKAEGEIEAGAKSVMRTAKVAFIDYAIHPETTNFSPYNLSFEVFEKDKYLQLRSALAALSQKTKNPTVEDVQHAAAAYGVNYQQMAMTDVIAGLSTYSAVIRAAGVMSTPTVVIRNARTGKIVKKLEGSKIKAADIRAAVAEVIR